jgi:hypothetical protein
MGLNYQNKHSKELKTEEALGGHSNAGILPLLAAGADGTRYWRKMKKQQENE